LRIGSYHAKVADLGLEHIRPQANENHSDVRTVYFTNESGKGYEITARETFGVQYPSSINSDFDEETGKLRRHTFDIPKWELLNGTIDHSQMEVGGANGWGMISHKVHSD